MISLEKRRGLDQEKKGREERNVFLVSRGQLVGFREHRSQKEGRHEREREHRLHSREVVKRE